MDDNKRRSAIRMEQLKDETMQSIRQVIEKHSEDRKKNTKKEITTRIINIFTKRMAEKGIRVDSQYLEGQLDVLVSELEGRDKKSDDYLQSQLNRFFNRHLEYAIENTEADVKQLNLRRNESRTEDIMDEDKSERRRAANNNQIPKIEEYLHDIFSHTMRMLEYRGINISQTSEEELRYAILSRLKHKTSEDMMRFFENSNNELSEDIKGEISKFFESVNYEISKEEQQSEDKKEKKPWELSLSEMANINPAKALKEAENNRQGPQNALPDHIID